MKRNRMMQLCCMVFAFAVTATFAATEREYIWPEGKMPDAQPHQIGATTAEVKAPGYKADDFRRPYLDWFDPPAADVRTDMCMILISGGGYNSCCDVGLVERWRQKLTALGVNCVSLTYRTPRPKGLPIHATAWEDGQRAVRLVRSQAAKRGFNPEKIGTISMSAGSHLATLLATSSQTPAYAPVDALDTTVPCHINWAVTCAIAYAITDGVGIPNTRDGDAIDAKLDPLFKFDAKTCPMCLFHGGKDVYSPNASTEVYRQLRRMKIPAELHLFADRPHGFFGNPAKGDRATGYDNWFGRAAEFLRQMNFDGRLGQEVALMSRFPDDAARASYEKEFLWPAGKTPDVQTNQCTPYLEWHMPKELKTTAIQIIYSGGSYMGNGPDGFEVAPARRYLNEKGMAVVTVKYRTPRPLGGLAKHTTAWQDLQRAIRIVRSKAASKGLDPSRIGIMGSSAGGHLTLMGATSSRSRAYWPVDALDKIPCNVQWAVAIYPAYALTDGAERPNEKGGNEDDSRLVPEFAFDPDTCPILFIHGDADGWAAMNSVKCWEQLRRMGVQCDLHTLATRRHCFQKMAAPGTGSYTWLDRIAEFLNHRKIFNDRTLTIVSAGDAFMVQRFPSCYTIAPQMKAWIGSGDARLVNFECVVNDGSCPPAAWSGGTWACMPPDVMPDLFKYGFNGAGCANNHSLDYSKEALFMTIAALDKAGIPHSGTGKDLQEASAPAFIDSPNGRVAFISVNTAFHPDARAGLTTSLSPGRPGMNALRNKQKFFVTPEHLAVLKEIAAATKVNGSRALNQEAGFTAPDAPGTFFFGGNVFQAAEKEGRTSWCDPNDLKRLKDDIARARARADAVVVLAHSHGIRADKYWEPDYYFEEFCRAAIDAGATAVIGGGTHQLKGIELRRGFPIFYSLGDFVFQNSVTPSVPPDFCEQYGVPLDSPAKVAHNARSKGGTVGLHMDRANFLSVLPKIEVVNGAVTRVTMMPIELNFGKDWSVNGLPRPAAGKDAEDIEKALARLSAEYGTEIVRLPDGTLEARPRR